MDLFEEENYQVDEDVILNSEGAEAVSDHYSATLAQQALDGRFIESPVPIAIATASGQGICFTGVVLDFSPTSQEIGF